MALEQARHAGEKGEVPVGAIVVQGEEMLSCGYNQPISGNDPTAHAEVMALRAASQILANYRLPGTRLYVTIEPCTMCVGALVHARVESVIFGAREPRAGALVSQQSLANEAFFNHSLQWHEGVLSEPCGSLVRDFFRAKRK